MQQLSLSLLPGRFAVCRLGPNEAIPQWVFFTSFWSVTRTDEELSLILPEELVLSSWKAEKGWRCLKVLGPLDFSITGIIASLSTALAEAGVSILAISTYDTDFLLVRSGDVDRAKEAITEHGHRISP
ncbi:MAG: ACT domain-containing protein [Deltaproteobacteria bacterium]|nr:ACT domain-containing protein [Deltaproteobacteria bacterium]